MSSHVAAAASTQRRWSRRQADGLNCLGAFLAELPDASAMLATVTALNAMIGGQPAQGETEEAFALLSRSLLELPQRTPPLADALEALKAQVASC